MLPSSFPKRQVTSVRWGSSDYSLSSLCFHFKAILCYQVSYKVLVGWEKKFETECLLQILGKPCIVSQVDLNVIFQWSAKNVLELDIGGICTAWCVLIVTELFNLKWLTLCYINFNSIKIFHLSMLIKLWTSPSSPQ